MMQYLLELANDQLLNIIPFVHFLKNNEGKDIEIIVNQESHCLRFCKIYELLDTFNFNSVTIFTDNVLESHDRYKIVIGNWLHWLNDAATQFNNNSDYSWNGQKVFGCFYGRPSASRLGIASYLNATYPNKSLLCLNFDYSSEDKRKLFDIERLFSWNINNILKFNLLFDNMDQFQLKLPAYNYTTFEYDFNHPINDLYKDIFVDVIVEAHLLGNSFLPSEKLARAVLCKKPFISMAPLFQLDYLKQLGFKTFNKFWDESYDNLYGKERYIAVLEVINYIANLSTIQLVDLNKEIQPILEHNYHVLKNQQFNINITKRAPHHEW